MRFGVLGPLAIWADDGRPVRVTGAIVRALLADLLVHHGEPVPADRLVDDLWPSGPPGSPSATLQSKVSQLRGALEGAEPGGRELVAYQPAGYALRMAPEAVDACRFADLLASARRRTDAGERAAMLTDALALWRGEVLADVADAGFAAAYVAGLTEQRLTAVEDLAEARLELGDHAAVADELSEVVSEHPLRERLRAARMRALYRAGRQGEALEDFRELRGRLADELGVDPGPAIVGLHTEILRHSPGLAARSRPAGPRSNLPADLTDLIGRGDEVAELRKLRDRSRLVTLTGPGGVGKTRLAIEAARQPGDVPDGTWLVDLTALPTPTGPVGEEGLSRVSALILAALRLTEGATATLPEQHPATLADRLCDALRQRRLLLVLDNCEHVIEPIAALAHRLLATAPGVRLLATSQEPLRIAGELVYVAPPLDLPPPAQYADPEALRRYSAVRLFETRAAAAQPGFAVDAANAGAVATICRRLDGIPLAIELAATQVRGIEVHELAARLDNRFRVLDTAQRAAPARQRTLRAMIDWSWDLLDDVERAVLRRLAVPTGGCTLDAAEAICADDERIAADAVPGVLARLVDRSLVVSSHDAASRRYDLLESVAAYALEQLDATGQTDDVRRRHRLHYLDLAELGQAQLRGREQRHWLRRLDSETPNLRTALDDAIAVGATEHAGRLVAALTWYWFLRGRFTEAIRSLDATLAVPDHPPGARAVAAAWRAGMGLLAGWTPHQPPEHTTGLIAAIEDPCQRATAQWFLGFAETQDCDKSLGRRTLTEALASFEHLDDQWGIAATLSTLAHHRANQGDFATARAYAERSYAIFEDLGDGWGQTQAAEWLIRSALHDGDPQRATRVRLAATRVAERLDLGQVAADLLVWQGRIAAAMGDYPQARSLHDRAIAQAAAQGYQPGQTFARLHLGMAALDHGDFDVAEANLAAVHDWHVRMNHGPAHDHVDVLTKLATIARRRGDTTGAQRWTAEVERCTPTPRTLSSATPRPDVQTPDHRQ